MLQGAGGGTAGSKLKVLGKTQDRGWGSLTIGTVLDGH